MRFLKYRTRRGRIVDLVVFAAIVFVILAILRFLPQPAPLQVSGQPRLIDGDSLFIRGIEVRLKGIDAPEAVQNCTRSGTSWPCGREATRALQRMLSGRTVECEGNEHDAHDRLLAICKAGTTNMNRWMVEQGWAVSFHDFPAEEHMALKAKRGIWSGTFIRPQDWRKENR